MTIGLLMSGQGAQRIDMGADLYATVPAYRAVIDAASVQLGYDVQSDLMGDATKLAQTQYAQLALYLMSLGLYAALDPHVKGQVSGLVGLSLGEYTALTAAGAADFAPTLDLLVTRGRLMQAASEATNTAMLVVLSAEQERVVTWLADAQARGLAVYPANFNSAKQLVVGGTREAVAACETWLTESGLKWVPLAVSGAFHTPLMQSANDVFVAEALSNWPVRAPAVPVYSNTMGAVFTDVKATLATQMVMPTYFGQACRALVDSGITTLIELGPQPVLAKLAPKIAPAGVTCWCIHDRASFDAVQAAILAKGNEQ